MTEPQRLPSECKMPDLSTIAQVRLIHSAIAAALIGDPDADLTSAVLRRNLARLVDKAIAEYQEAREAILAQVRDLAQPPPGGPGLFFVAFANAFEVCVITTNRALRIFEHLRAGRLSARIPRKWRHGLDAHTASIRPMRDALEHVDEAIRSGEISGEMPIMVALTEPHDRAQIGPHVVKFEDLARVLRELHRITDACINGRVP